MEGVYADDTELEVLNMPEPTADKDIELDVTRLGPVDELAAAAKYS